MELQTPFATRSKTLSIPMDRESNQQSLLPDRKKTLEQCLSWLTKEITKIFPKAKTKFLNKQ